MIPHVVFIGVYIKPESSQFFDPLMFSELCSYIIECHEHNKTGILRGDFNNRPGELNNIRNNNLWIYTENMDKYSNSHGRTYFPVLCNSADVMPLNHLVFNHSTFQGDYTYHKADMKSQIDFSLTDMNGRNFIKKCNIIQQNCFRLD